MTSMKTNSPASQNPTRASTRFHRKTSGWLLKLAVTFVAVVAAQAATVSVDVGPGGNLVFAPQDITVQAGDTVVWTWQSDHHTVTSGLFDSGLRARGATFSFTFQKVQKVAYDCTPHGNLGMVGSVTVSAAGPAASQPLNISTRMRVQTGENVMIGGFIVTGNVP